MSSQLPRPPSRPPAHDAGRERPSESTFVYEIRGNRKVGGLAAAVLGALLFATIVTFLVIGAITFTLTLWLACAAVVVGFIVAFFRRLFRGEDRGAPPGGRH
jgi:hypothetical protein